MQREWICKYLCSLTERVSTMECWIIIYTLNAQAITMVPWEHLVRAYLSCKCTYHKICLLVKKSIDEFETRLSRMWMECERTSTIQTTNKCQCTVNGGKHEPWAHNERQIVTLISEIIIRIYPHTSVMSLGQIRYEAGWFWSLTCVISSLFLDAVPMQLW